jgi:uncharacterized repeat protein (TIGR01451 family)
MGSNNHPPTQAPRSTVTITPTAAIDPSATLVTSNLINTATVTAPADVTDLVPGNNSATDTDLLTPRADLAVDLTGVHSPASPLLRVPESDPPVFERAPTEGFAFTYTLTVRNNGPSTATDVVLRDPLPTTTSGVTTSAGLQGVTFVSVSDEIACRFDIGTSPEVGGTVVCNFVDLRPGVRTVTIVVRLREDGTVENNARVTSPVFDPIPNNNDALPLRTTAREAPLRIWPVERIESVSTVVGSRLVATFTDGATDALRVRRGATDELLEDELLRRLLTRLPGLVEADARARFQNGAGYRAGINWGDPASGAANESLGVIEPGAGVFADFRIFGSHTFITPATYCVVVAVRRTGAESIVRATTWAMDLRAVYEMPPDGMPPRTPIRADIGDLPSRRLGALFTDIFGRPVATGTTGKLALGLTSSPLAQHRAVRGALETREYAVSTVRRMYIELLGRDPFVLDERGDPALDEQEQFQVLDPGVYHWAQFLTQVGSDQQLRALLMGSLEYYNRAGGTPEAFVKRVYRDGLGRDPEGAGLENWVQRLRDGMTHAQVAHAILHSDEGLIQLLREMYHRILRRAPDGTILPLRAHVDESGLQTYLPILRERAGCKDVLIALYTSDEFVARSTPEFACEDPTIV